MTQTPNRSGGQQVVDQAQAAAGQAVDQAQQKMGDAVDQAKETVTSRASQQKDRAAEGLHTVADAIRQTGDSLRQQDQGFVADYAESAASYIERASGYLQERDFNQLAGEVERFARRSPALFLGSAFALGWAAARFLKSSSRTGYDYQRGNYPMAPRSGQYGVARSYGSTAYSRPAGAPASYGTGLASGSGSEFGASRAIGATGYETVDLGSRTAGTSATSGMTGGAGGATSGSTPANTRTAGGEQFSVRRDEP
jgi:hypothetical protein